jgi:hypothetical protein
MTVTTQQNKLVYTGNGSSTTYPVNTLSGDVLTGIVLYNASELMVYVNGVLKVLNTDYTITSSIPPSNLIGRLVNASVVFTTAPANTLSIVLLRQLPYTQTLNLLDGNNPPPEQLETSLDKTVSQIQQVADSVTRCFQLDPKTPSTAPTPYLIPSVDTFIGWDNAGNLVNRTANDISVLVSTSTTNNVNANRAAILEVTAAGGFGTAIVGNLYEAIVALYTAAINVSAAALTALINANTTAIDNLIKTVAYVNFDRATPANVAATYTQSGTTVTVTLNGHNHKVAHFVFCDNFTGGSATGGYIITGVTTNTFTYTSTSSLTTSGTLILKRSTVRSSKNIHSVYYTNTVGLTYVNLDTVLPNANYVTQYSVGNAVFNNAVPIGDGGVIGQTTLYVAVESHGTTGSAIDFPYNAVTIVQ